MPVGWGVGTELILELDAESGLVQVSQQLMLVILHKNPPLNELTEFKTCSQCQYPPKQSQLYHFFPARQGDIILMLQG